MLNKIYLFSLLFLFAACNSGGGGGSSSGGGNPNPPAPTYSEISRNFSLQANQTLNLNLEAETYSSITTEVPPTKGTLSGTYPNLAYKSNASATGSDQAVLFLTKSGSTKRIRLNFYINNIPVAQSFTIYVERGQGINFDLQGSDLDGDVLTYKIIQGPALGTLFHSTTGKEVGYNAYNSPATTNFFYQVNDGKSDSNIGKVDIIIVPSIPVITSPTTYSFPEDTAQAITVTASDSANSTITYSISQNPTNGLITGSNGSYTYTPNLNYNGPDSFKVRATNTSSGFSEKVINLTITPVNDAPVFPNLSATTLENTDTFFIAGATDPDGNSLTYTIQSQGSLGIAAIGANDRIFYYPNYNTSGIDTFAVKVCDNGSPIMCSIASVEITIVRELKAPIAYDQDNVLATAGQPIQIILTGSFYNSSAVTSVIVNPVSNGTLVKNSEFSYTYTPNVTSKLPGAVMETDYFSFTLTEDGFTSEQAVVTINVTYIYNLIGLNWDGGISKLSSLETILHQDESLGYSLGKNSYPDPNDNQSFLENIYFTFHKDYLNCTNNTSVFNMLPLSSTSLNSGEKLTINSNYNCDNNILKNASETETIYLTDSLILRDISDADSNRVETQIGVKVGSTVNNTSLNSLLSLNLQNVDKLSIFTGSKLSEESEVNFSSLITQNSIIGQSGVLKYFFKSSEALINYANSEETFEIYHELKEENNELKLVNKYYLTPSGMRLVQDLVNDWFATLPGAEASNLQFTINSDAGRIIVVDDVVLVRRQESILSFFSDKGPGEGDEEESFFYFLSEEAVMEIYNKKL